MEQVPSWACPLKMHLDDDQTHLAHTYLGRISRHTFCATRRNGNPDAFLSVHVNQLIIDASFDADEDAKDVSHSLMIRVQLHKIPKFSGEVTCSASLRGRSKLPKNMTSPVSSFTTGGSHRDSFILVMSSSRKKPARAKSSQMGL